MNIDNTTYCIKESCKLFPRVVLLNIYYHLDIKDLYNCSSVSKHFNRLFDSDMLWDKLLCRFDVANVDQVKVNYNVTKSKVIFRIISDLLSVDKVLDIYETIDGLINLKYLYRNNNSSPQTGILSSLPKEIGSLINLRQLYLNYNQLTELPKEIGSLIQLTGLYLCNNKLTSLPRTGFAPRCLPKEIGSLVNLQCLYLSNNQLTVIPKEIGSLIHLQLLYLDNNKLTTLPKEIGSLRHLYELVLRDNQLTGLPTEIELLVDTMIIT